MKRELYLAFLIAFAAALTTVGQENPIEPPTIRGRVVITNSMPPPPTPSPKPSQTPIAVGTQSPPPKPSQDVKAVNAAIPPARKNTAGPVMSFGQIKRRIAEAKRQMQGRPIATAISESTMPIEVVRIAFHDWKTREIDYVLMTKESFLTTNADKLTLSEKGRRLIARTIRGNGVNTPVTLTDENGEAQLPLLVQYPVVRGGIYIETAYYMSTHPGLVTPEVVNAGKYYVRNVIEIARDRLRQKGIAIQPKVADIAERLAGVEHVDHQRFRTEMHSNIYNDVFTLFALNEGQTYRYSVSSAGAGGMVQMIPATYRMMRSMYPGVGLMPDFVEGMRNHVNASEAMLLYMQMTWNDLIRSPIVSGAMLNGIATQQQLMAAGYNSNPARLPGYINRGGENWTNLIPRETKIYLQIYDSMERFAPIAPRTR